MLQYNFQVYFIFMLYLIALANCDVSQGTTVKLNCESPLHNCSCSNNKWQKEAIAVTCNEMTNVATFFNSLDSDDTLAGYNTYSLTLNNINHLPARIFSGRKIDDLNLNGIDTTVDDNVFDETTSLRKFVVHSSSMENIPDFRYVKDSIEVVLIFSSRLTTLEGDHLQNLNRLVHLSFYNNSIRCIDPDVFLGAENLTTLDLSHNQLTILPSDLLKPMKKLFSFHASHNNLEHLNYLFTTTTHLTEIYLDFNKIKDLDTLLYFQLENVTTLVLSNNPIKRVSKDNFNGKINNVVNLHLQNCELKELEVEHYEHLSKLQVLDLSYNLFEDVSKTSSEIASFKNRLTTLMLTGNKLKGLDFIQNAQVVNLGVGENKLTHLTDEDFKSVQTMEFLELHNNEIQRIDSNTFQPIKNDLQRLDLSSNFIKSLNGSIRDLCKLKVLNITQNLIQSFVENEFTGLTSLTKIYVQYNQIKVLGQLDKVLNLQFLDIAHNDIEIIRPDQMPKKLAFMNLADNSFKCDCRIQPFLLQVTKSSTLETDASLCSQADSPNGLHKRRCPKMCSCYCAGEGDESFMFVNCSSKQLCNLPQFSHDEIPNSVEDPSMTPVDRFVTDQTLYPSLRIQDRILGINLENNSLESLNTNHLPQYLTHLYLSNNKLRKLPNFVIDSLPNLKKISLSRNPWDCDCSTMKFKTWLLTHNAIIQDMREVRCGIGNNADSSLDGRSVWLLGDQEICKSNKKLIYYIFIGILCVIVFSLAMKLLYTKHQIKIKRFLNSISGKKDSHVHKDSFISAIMMKA